MMKKTLIGLVLLFLSAMLYATHYISLAILSGDRYAFCMTLKLNDTGIYTLIYMTLIIGIIFIISDLITSRKN